MVISSSIYLPAFSPGLEAVPVRDSGFRHRQFHPYGDQGMPLILNPRLNILSESLKAETEVKNGMIGGTGQPPPS